MLAARIPTTLILAWCCLAPALAAPAPSEARVSLAPFQETRLGEIPGHTGHLLRERVATFDFGPRAYAIKHTGCVDPAHGGQVSPLEGYIGMPQPSACNWYHSGFLDVAVNGQSIGTASLSSMTASECGQRAILDMVWKHPVADVRVRFMAFPGDDHLLCEVALDPKEPVTSLVVHLTCYPSYFTAAYHRNGARRVQTPSALTPEPETAALPAAESWWALYYDEVFDVALGEGAGPCAVMLDPAQASEVRLSVGNYAVGTSVTYPPETRRLRMAFWDMTGTSNADALAQMQTGAQGCLERLRGLNFTPTALGNADVGAMRAEVAAALQSAEVRDQLGDRLPAIDAWLDAPAPPAHEPGEPLSVAGEEEALSAFGSYRDFMWELRLAELLAGL